MTTFSTLPAEVLDHIAKYLVAPKLGFEDNGTVNLRLTCRTIYLNTQHDFARAAFSTLWLDLQPETLEWMLTVSKRPAYEEVVKQIVVAHWGSEIIPFPDIDDEGDFENLEDKVLQADSRLLSFQYMSSPYLCLVMRHAPPYLAR